MKTVDALFRVGTEVPALAIPHEAGNLSRQADGERQAAGQFDIEAIDKHQRRYKSLAAREAVVTKPARRPSGPIGSTGVPLIPASARRRSNISRTASSLRRLISTRPGL